MFRLPFWSPVPSTESAHVVGELDADGIDAEDLPKAIFQDSDREAARKRRRARWFLALAVLVLGVSALAALVGWQGTRAPAAAPPAEVPLGEGGVGPSVNSEFPADEDAGDNLDPAIPSEFSPDNVQESEEETSLKSLSFRLRARRAKSVGGSRSRGQKRSAAGGEAEV